MSTLIPLGGYVALVGENDKTIPEGFTEKDIFSKRPAWQRFFVFLAGPMANFLLALIICCMLAFFYGTPYLTPEVGSVKIGSPAANAGFMVGDVILSIDKKSVTSWSDVITIVSKSEGRPLRFEIERKNKNVLETKYIEVAAKQSLEEKNRWIVGIVSSGKREVREENFLLAIGDGINQTWYIIKSTWFGLGELIQGKVATDQLGGPIMIAQLIGQQVENGLKHLLSLIAFIKCAVKPRPLGMGI